MIDYFGKVGIFEIGVYGEVVYGLVEMVVGGFGECYVGVF